MSDQNSPGQAPANAANDTLSDEGLETVSGGMSIVGGPGGGCILIPTLPIPTPSPTFDPILVDRPILTVAS